jgi:phage terminase large subunit-like protein
VLEVEERVRELASEYTIRECAFDPWRFRETALRLEQEGLRMVQFDQTAARMVPASERLYAAIVEGRLRHDGDPELARHVAAAVAKDTGRGWRIDKRGRTAQVDAVVALAMALERAEQPAPKAELLGWL